MKNLLFAPKDVLNLVVFRVAFSTILLWEVVRYFEKDWINKYWIKPAYNFTYEGFEWVKPWAGQGMYLHFYLLGLLALCIMLGLFYRVATVLLFSAFTYMFLLEQVRYLNHFFLLVQLSFLLIFIPAHQKYSLDSLFWKKLKSDYVPAWTVFLLAFQVGVAYFFGGIAKLNADWLLLAEPMRHRLSNNENFPIIGQFFDEPWMAYFFSWSGLLLDLLAPFLLAFRRTRPFMFIVILAFHIMNDRMFNIGIFPWFMILASTIFFPADWLKRFASTIWKNPQYQGVLILVSAVVVLVVGSSFRIKPDRALEFMPSVILGLSGAIMMWLFLDLFFPQAPEKKKIKQAEVPVFFPKKWVIPCLGFWALMQIAVPLRHCFIPGNVSWTEEGHRFSWHMKLRVKTGEIKFYIFDPQTGNRAEVDLRQYLRSWQIDDMSTKPYLIQQFAQYLDKKLIAQGQENYELRVEANASLNYRIYQPLIDPNVDISKQTYSDFRHNNWILQLDPSLNPKPVRSKELESDLE